MAQDVQLSQLPEQVLHLSAHMMLASLIKCPVSSILPSGSYTLTVKPRLIMPEVVRLLIALPMIIIRCIEESRILLDVKLNDYYPNVQATGFSLKEQEARSRRLK